MPIGTSHAVAEFIVGPLCGNPFRVGKPLTGGFIGLYSARVGEYRVLYSIDVEHRLISVSRITHRRDAYRPR